MAESVQFQKGDVKINGGRSGLKFSKEMQGFTDSRFGQILKSGCRDPWTVKSVRIFQRVFRDQQTVDLVRVL